MRSFVLTVATVFGLLMLPVAAAGIERPTTVVNGTVLLSAHALEAQEKPVINIEINKGGGGSKAWYANPVWMAIGGLGVLVVIVLVVMAAKGGGTTVVKG